jgi:DNA-binding Lrp family transcriptional regulator
MVTAIILIKAERGAVETAAQGLLKIKGITEVYSVAGEFDIVAVARVRQNEDLASLVTEEMRSIQGITRTETLIAFRQYSNFDLAAMFDLE